MMSRQLTLIGLLFICLCGGCTDSSQDTSSPTELGQLSPPQQVATSETTPDDAANTGVNQSTSKPAAAPTEETEDSQPRESSVSTEDSQPAEASTDDSEPKGDSATTDGSEPKGETTATKANPQSTQSPQQPIEDKSVEELISDLEDTANAGDFAAAIEIAKAILKKEPKQRQVMLLLARLYFTQAVQQEENLEVAASRPYYLKFESTMRTFRSSFKELEPFEQQLLVIALFKAGATYASKSDSAKALESLTDSFKTSFKDLEVLGKKEDADSESNMLFLQQIIVENFESLENKDDFKSLREAPEFKALIQDVSDKLRRRFRLAAELKIGKHEPFPFEFSLPDLQGKTLSLKDLKGKLVIVDFWGTWCPPCLQEIPHFIALKKKYAKHGFEIVGLSYEDGPEEDVREFIGEFYQANKMNYPCVIGDEETQARLPIMEGFPTTLFIDRRGRVRLQEVGYHSLLELEAAVNVLLDEDPAVQKSELVPPSSSTK